jgi:hypothetical protein
MIYCYWVSLGLASLHKMHTNGNDTGAAPKKIGKFKTDAEAKQACFAHYEKSCKMAVAAGREKPEILFM